MIDPAMFLEDSLKEEQGDDDDDFLDWKEGFMDDMPVVNMFSAESPYLTEPTQEPLVKRKRIRKPRPRKDRLGGAATSNQVPRPSLDSSPASSRPTTPAGGNGAMALDADGELAPTRIRRQYSCDQCTFRTVNPREFLYHRRDMHGVKVKIVECQYCIYACQYAQKLQRHIQLVHKLEAPASGTKRPKKEPAALEPSDESNNSDKPKSLLEASLQRGSQQAKLQKMQKVQPAKIRATPAPKLLKSSPVRAAASAHRPTPREQPLPQPLKREEEASYFNDDAMDSDSSQQPLVIEADVSIAETFKRHPSSSSTPLNNNQRHRQQDIEVGKGMGTVDDDDEADNCGETEAAEAAEAALAGSSDKLFKCDECGYSTHVHYLYKKHVKYHTAPKIKCELCDFESPYSWNVERHARSHANNGAFNCTKCTYACETPQALTVHLTKHHRDGDGPNPSPTPSMIDEASNQEDIVVTPDIGFAFIPNGLNSPSYDASTNMYYSQPGLQPNVPYSSAAEAERSRFSVSGKSSNTGTPAVAAGHPPEKEKEKEVKLLHCAYCSFTHKESKSMVSHMSVHTGKKPYRCKHCGFSSNWKEVVARHAKSRHDGSNSDVDQLFKYTVNKFICRIIDETGELNVGPEVTTLEDILKAKAAVAAAHASNTAAKTAASQPSHSSLRPAVNKALIDHESMICPSSSNAALGEDPLDNRLINADGKEVASRLSGLRGAFKCELCPFRGEKAFHIDFHLKRHQQTKGADFKCPHCPYWVNAKKSLVRHIYLHDYENGNLTMQVGNEAYLPIDDELEDEEDNEFEQQVKQVQSQPATSNLMRLLQAGQNVSTGKKCATRSPAAKNRCDSCPFVAGTKTQLLYHKQFHRPNRAAPYKCSLCSYAVSHQHLLNQHFKVHYRDTENTETPVVTYQPYVSPDKNSDEQGGTEDPSESERDEPSSDIAYSMVDNGNGQKQRVYHCRHCPTSSKRRTYIVVHEQMHNMNSLENFKCSSCEYTTRNSTAFLKHLSSHTQQPKKAQESLIIPRISVTPLKRSYNEMQAVGDNESASTQNYNHSNKSPSSTIVDSSSIKYGNRRMFSYVCKDCPAAFKSPGDLKIHSVFHGELDDNYQYECAYCNYKAKNKPQLCKHLFVHTADYIKKRANSYPDGTKLTIGEGLLQPKSKEATATKHCGIQVAVSTSTPNNQQKTENGENLPAPPPLYVPQQQFKNRTTHTAAGSAAASAALHPEKVAFNDEDDDSMDEFDDDVDLEPDDVDDDDDAEQSFVDVDEFMDSDMDISQTPILLSHKSKRPCITSGIRFQSEQMCLIESTETRDFLNKLRQRAKHRFIHRCPACPASFQKANTLKFHSSLHGYSGRLRCKHCSYSADYDDNLTCHETLHANSALAVTSNSGMYSYNHRCHKCPAQFSKPSRLEKHITLHGSGAKWRCDKCDYAVPYAATLVKHKHVHDVDMMLSFDDPTLIDLDLFQSPHESLSSPPATPKQQQPGQPEKTFKSPRAPQGAIPSNLSLLANFSPITTPKLEKPGKEVEPSVLQAEDRTLFCCDRCPYNHGRRDAVQSHMKRHEQERNYRDGKKCPHCDYICLQPSYLREHIRVHFEPANERKPGVFRFCNECEIWAARAANGGGGSTSASASASEGAKHEEEKSLLFKDLGTEKTLRERFEPHEEDEEFFDMLKDTNSQRLLSLDVDDDKVSTVLLTESKHNSHFDVKEEDEKDKEVDDRRSISDISQSSNDSGPGDPTEIDEAVGAIMGQPHPEDEILESLEEENCELMVEEQEVYEEPLNFQDHLEDVVEESMEYQNMDSDETAAVLRD